MLAREIKVAARNVYSRLAPLRGSRSLQGQHLAVAVTGRALAGAEVLSVGSGGGSRSGLRDFSVHGTTVRTDLSGSSTVTEHWPNGGLSTEAESGDGLRPRGLLRGEVWG